MTTPRKRSTYWEATYCDAHGRAFAWIVFRARSLRQADYMASRLSMGPSDCWDSSYMRWEVDLLGARPDECNRLVYRRPEKPAEGGGT